MKRILARVTEPGWNQRMTILDSGDLKASLLWYPDGTVRFEHHCDRGRRGLIVCAPALQIGPHGNGHTVQPLAPHYDTLDIAATVSPSILCTDCNAHGFVTNGRWRSC